MGGNLLFFDCCTCFPRNAYDSRVLRNSATYAKIETSQILNSSNDLIGYVTIRALVLGNGVYPLLTWLMRPYNI